jgi:hypothetical protein
MIAPICTALKTASFWGWKAWLRIICPSKAANSQEEVL